MTDPASGSAPTSPVVVTTPTTRSFPTSAEVDLHKLAHFVALAHTRSFARAAENLRLSQSALTRSIQALERTYRVQLFDRGPNGAELTSAGRQLLVSAENLLHNAQTFRREVETMAGGLSGTVSFGLGPVIAHALLPNLLLKVIEQYPGISISTTIGPFGVLAPRLESGEDEFFVSRAADLIDSARYRFQSFGRSRAVFYVRPGHPLTMLDIVRVADLVPYRLLAVNGWNEATDHASALTDSPPLRASIVVDNLTHLATVVRNCDAVLVATNLGASEGVVALPVEPFLVVESDERSGVFTARDRTLSPAARAVLALLRRGVQSS